MSGDFLRGGFLKTMEGFAPHRSNFSSRSPCRMLSVSFWATVLPVRFWTLRDSAGPKPNGGACVCFVGRNLSGSYASAFKTKVVVNIRETPMLKT